MLDRIDMEGALTLVLTDVRGQTVLRRRHGNHIVHSGRRLVAELFAGVTGTAPGPVTKLAVGTGDRPPSDTDQALQAPRGDPKAIAEVHYEDLVDEAGRQRRRVQLRTVFARPEMNHPRVPLREAGVLNDAGTLYSRVVFPPVTKTDTFELTLLWDIVF